jgi:iron-sulfur cluster assembly accessory protein
MAHDISPAVAGAPQAAENQPILVLTEQAVAMLKEAMEREGARGFGLRVGVVGGGCSGFQYHLAFEETPTAEDAVFEQGGVRIFVDKESQPHLHGVTLDYVTGLHAAGFKFLNPNASRTCGCGSSFAT